MEVVLCTTTHGIIERWAVPGFYFCIAVAGAASCSAISKQNIGDVQGEYGLTNMVSAFVPCRIPNTVLGYPVPMISSPSLQRCDVITNSETHLDARSAMMHEGKDAAHGSTWRLRRMCIVFLIPSGRPCTLPWCFGVHGKSHIGIPSKPMACIIDYACIVQRTPGGSSGRKKIYS